MKAKHDALVEALDGMSGDHHGELAALLLDQIAALDAKIAQRDPRPQPRPGPSHHRRDRPGHVPVPHRRPPGLLGG